MSLGRILGLVAIIVGVVAAIVGGTVLFNPLTWFVLAIALVIVLDGVGVPFTIGRGNG